MRLFGIRCILLGCFIHTETTALMVCSTTAKSVCSCVVPSRANQQRYPTKVQGTCTGLCCIIGQSCQNKQTMFRFELGCEGGSSPANSVKRHSVLRLNTPARATHETFIGLSSGHARNLHTNVLHSYKGGRSTFYDAPASSWAGLEHPTAQSRISHLHEVEASGYE